MAYATISLTQALSDLGRRLYDPSSVFWTDAEKTIYLKESVRTFAALTNFYRDTFPFTTVLNQHWYDLATISGTIRPFTVTDVDLYTVIEDHFLEPPTGATWTGSAQFTINDLLQAVQRRRDQLLYDTGCTLVRSTQATNGTVTNALDERDIDVRRVAWLPGSVYTNSPLWRDDVWAQQSYDRNDSTPGQPSIYKQSTQPPLSFVTDIPPAVAGNYEVLTVRSGAALSAGSPTTLVIPDDWAWVVKFGAMADLLSRESLSKDISRAQYCQSRYDQGVAMMRSSPALLYALIGSNVLDIDAVQYGDDYRPGWQAESASTPDMAYVVGINLLALAPKPTAGLTVTATVLYNAPFPASGGAFFQFGREDYDPILDYAQHLAAFKQGGAEFAATLPLLKNFVMHCAIYNSKLLTMGEFTDVLYDTSQLQEQADPRLVSGDKE